MDVSQDLFRIAHRSKTVSNTLEDYELLASLLSLLSPKDDQNAIRDSIFDKKVEEPVDINKLNQVSQRCDNVWTARDGVDWLLFYIFYRRYGWDDGTNQQTKVQVFCPSITERARWTLREEELKFKERLIAVSADLITWFETQPLKLSTLKLFNSAIRVAKCSPTTRHHMAIHTIQWLTAHLESASNPSGTKTSVATSSPFLPSDATPETMYLAVKDLMMLTMANSLYSTRTAVIPLMSRLLLQLSLVTILRLLDQIIDTFNRQEVNRWEEAEGLLNALGLLIKRALPLSTVSEEHGYVTTQNGVPGNVTTMSLETYESQILPQVKLLVFNLFDHDHPSVRIGAVHLYITCLKRCEHPTIEKALDEIMNEVCVKKDSDPYGSVEDMGPSLGAHATESLLSLCQVLLKYYFMFTCRAGGVKLPPSTGYLQNNLIEVYLGHPDLNVRMAACHVFVILIISALDNTNRVRYLMRKALENWPLKQEILLLPLQRTFLSKDGTKTAANQVVVPDQVATWREGRLKIFERVCQTLLQRHYSVLYNVLVRIPDDEASGLEEGMETQRLYTHLNHPMKGHLPQLKSSIGSETSSHLDHRRSTMMEETIFASTQRRLSNFINLESSGPHHKGSHFRLWGHGSRKNSDGRESILDRLRKADELDKVRKKESVRASVWKNELAKRFSVVALKTSHKTQSLGAVSEQDTMNMSAIFSQILHLSAECLVSDPRELRQCGRATFSEVIRLLRWYNPDMIGEFLSNNLLNTPTLMSYVSLKMLRSALDEFILFDRLVFCNEELGQLESNPDAFGKTGQIVDLFPNGYFLNVPLMHIVFNNEKSSSWLRVCQQYLTDDNVPTFVALPALRCVVATLSLAHLLPKFAQAARHTESLKPTLVGDKADLFKFNIDATSLVESVRAATTYIRRFEISLDEKYNPTTITGEHLKIRSLRPFNIRYNEKGSPLDMRRTRTDVLAPFLCYIINNLEHVLFRFIPPSPNPTKPDAITRRNAGLMLAPMLSQIITWPLALLPPGTAEMATSSSAGREKKLLAVRKLLRLIASIVHAIPVAEAPASNFLSKSDDKLALPRQIESIVSNRVDLTNTTNAYFSQLEKMMDVLSKAWAPTPLCQSPSWWWFRAMCEHMPRMLQVAPHANPITLIRHLLDAGGKVLKPGRPIKQAPRLLSQRRIMQLWSKAIAYSKIEARKKLISQRKGSSFGYRWPTVGELLKTVGQSRTESTSTSSDRRSTSDKKKSDGSEDMDSVFDSHSDIIATMNYKNPAFDYMTDEEEDLVLEPAEPESSSSDEVEMCERKLSRKRMSISRPGRRRRMTSGSEPKAQAIETPPPYTDIVDLVKRIWRYCQPVTIGTLKNILSNVELSMINGEVDPYAKSSTQLYHQAPTRMHPQRRQIRIP